MKILDRRQFAMGIFPAAERLRGRRQAGVDAEGMQQAIVGKAQHVGTVPCARLSERPGFKGDIAQGEKPEFRRECVASEDKRRIEGCRLVDAKQPEVGLGRDGRGQGSMRLCRE